MSAAATLPSPARMILSGLIVAGFAVGIWAYIAHRSAAPEPPKVELPGGGMP
jgi:hypothetical protein